MVLSDGIHMFFGEIRFPFMLIKLCQIKMSIRKPCVLLKRIQKFNLRLL